MTPASKPPAAGPPRAHPTGRAPRPGALFTSTTQIAIGAAVYDRDFEMPGTVRNIRDWRIELERPTGFVWNVHFRRLRPATAREQRQLAALAKLRRQQLRGLPQRARAAATDVRR